MVTWLCAEVLPKTHQPEHVEAAVYDRFRALRIEPPTADRVLRFVKSALSTFEQQFCQSVVERLSEPTRKGLEALLTVEASEPDTEDAESGQSPNRVVLHELRADSGRATLDGVNPTWMTPGATRKKAFVIRQVTKGLFVLLSLRVYSFWQGMVLR